MMSHFSAVVYTDNEMMWKAVFYDNRSRFVNGNDLPNNMGTVGDIDSLFLGTVQLGTPPRALLYLRYENSISSTVTHTACRQ